LDGYWLGLTLDRCERITVGDIVGIVNEIFDGNGDGIADSCFDGIALEVFDGYWLGLALGICDGIIVGY